MNPHVGRVVAPLRRPLLAALLLACIAASGASRTVASDPVAAVAATTYYVPPTGENASSGSTSSPTPPPRSPTTTVIDPNFPTGRNKYRWPFTADSIWNMPIGSGAVYANAGLTPASQLGTQPDEEYIGLDPSAPLQHLTATDHGDLGNVFVPSDFSWDGRWNGSAAFLRPDLDTVWQGQPLVLNKRGAPSWDMTTPHSSVSLSQDAGMLGGHGGSGLSTVGGSIRDGELSGPDPIRHALKIEIDCKQYCYFNGVGSSHRWPAIQEDDPVDGVRYGGTNPKLMPGALLALPRSFDVSTLANPQARKIATALQNYGAYVVDETAGDYYSFCVEYRALNEWHGGQGWYPGTVDTTEANELQSLYPKLQIIDNNGPASVGGGGTPLVEKAPPFN